MDMQGGHRLVLSLRVVIYILYVAMCSQRTRCEKLASTTRSGIQHENVVTGAWVSTRVDSPVNTMIRRLVKGVSVSSNLARDRSGLPVAASQRILVTGGAGFIGSHLCRRLIAEGHDVLAVDNFYSSTRHNIADLLDEPRFELMRYDVTFPLYVEVDQIYHLACPASPIFYQRDPVQTTKTCVHGSINVLGLAKRLRSPILLASTSEIYGDPLMHPQSESYWGNVNSTGIRACYDEGKRCAETLFFDYHRQHMVVIKVARIFNTYGPNMLPNDGRVVSSFMVQALRNKPLQVFGDGSQTRSFCYVDDMVDGLIRLMNSPQEVTGPINLGNPDEFTMLELAKRVLALVGSDSPIEHHPLPSDDPARRKPDIGQAREMLGWEPTVQLEEGLERTFDYFRRTLAG
jgi:UDP-glucuronate decarboxylase